MLLAHIDVVEARREDWERDPFKFVEEDGFFYARGATTTRRWRRFSPTCWCAGARRNFVPRRGIRLALTCGEETSGHFNGVSGCSRTIPNSCAPNSSSMKAPAGARCRRQAGRLDVQAGEKVYQDFTLEVTHKGGHSSRPPVKIRSPGWRPRCNRLAEYQFPVASTTSLAGYFRAQARFARRRESPRTCGRSCRIRQTTLSRNGCGRRTRPGTA